MGQPQTLFLSMNKTVARYVFPAVTFPHLVSSFAQYQALISCKVYIGALKESYFGPQKNWAQVVKSIGKGPQHNDLCSHKQGLLFMAPEAIMTANADYNSIAKVAAGLMNDEEYNALDEQ